MKKKVLIAVGSKSYADILKDTFVNHPNDFVLSSQEVFHRRFLEEIIETEKPDILLIHDYYLDSDYTRQEQKEQEFVSIIKKIRVKYDDSIRVVFLCERPKGDPFISRLVSMGVWDVFNTHSYDLEDFIAQLLDKSRFSRVEKFLVHSGPFEQQDDPEEPSDFEPTKGARDEEKNEKPIVQKVVEKKVVQKVVNKTTIKRDYSFHVHNHTERIVGIPVKKKLVMIGSPMSRSGSTFIAHLLTRALTQLGVSTTYVESPFSKAYTYDRFYGHIHTENYRSKFYQSSKDFNSKINIESEWMKSDVELICKHPVNEPVYRNEEVTFENLIKVLFSSSSSVTVIDVGTDWQHELFQDTFDIADHAYFIMEPDIPLIQSFEESQSPSIELLRKQLDNEKSSIIFNRFEKSIFKNSLLKDLYSEKIVTYFSSFPVTDVFEAQYQGIFLNDYMDYQKRLGCMVQPLLEDILPQEFMKKKKKNSGLLKGIFNKKFVVEKSETKGEETPV
ncbi:hypothetical protein [Mesobacillus zeae]|uniref:hypothetical protein n=1 Tax=Mesobacillus zeae TaxID=1917180 RepID=UPI003008E8D5